MQVRTGGKNILTGPQKSSQITVHFVKESIGALYKWQKVTQPDPLFSPKSTISSNTLHATGGLTIFTSYLHKERAPTQYY